MRRESNPLVSIITPSLNQGRFVEQTILSVLNQTYKTVEYIIMDGGSTDNTIEIISSYAQDKRIKWFSNCDEGQYDAVNKGFMMAQGDILGWINADDLYTESTIEKIVKVFVENDNVEIVYGRFYHIDEANTFLRQMPARPYSLKWLRRFCFINPSVTFLRKTVIQHDGFLIDNSIPAYGDWDWFLRLAEAGKTFYFLPEFLGHFRMHPDSKIARMNKTEVHQERLMISRRHNIALNYINVWADLLMPWFQRIEYCSYLVKEKNWRLILKRMYSVYHWYYKDLLKKIT